MMISLQNEMLSTQRVVNNEVEVYNKIRNSATKDEQLKKAAAEFESIFIAQMLTRMDNTVDRQGGIFENNGMYMKNLKSYMFQQVARDMSTNSHNSFGLAKQIYEQMKVCLPQESTNSVEG